MADKETPFFEKPYSPIDEMSPEEIKADLLQFRNLLTWLSPEVMYYLSRVGELCRITTRSGASYLGTLGICQFEPTCIVIRVSDRTFDYSTQIARYETKDVAVRSNDINGIQFITEVNEVEEITTFKTQEELKVEEEIENLEKGNE